MSLDPAEITLRGMAWLSLAAWAACEWLRRRRPGEPGRNRSARAAFTVGLVALVLHSLIAFQIRYAWSHDAALADAGRQIAAVTGQTSASGFFVNYVFIAWWALEAFAWWAFAERYRRRPRAVHWASRALFAFMFANGAIVFARGPVRVFGAAVVLAAVWAWAPPKATPQAGSSQRDGA